MENMSQLQPSRINLQPADLRRYFLTHLNKIYCAKDHLVKTLPGIGNMATFNDLKEAINSTIGDLLSQLARMREIYQILNETYESSTCQMFVGLIDDLVQGVDAEKGNTVLQDMSIIYYLQNIESLEMASFHALQMAGLKFKNAEINQLLKDNFDEAKAERTLLRLLTARYLTS